MTEPWATELADFRAHQRRSGRRHTTIKSHVAHLRTLARTVPAGPAAVTPTDVLLWLDERGPSARNAWKTGRVFYAWALSVGLVTVSPVAPAPAARRVPARSSGEFPEAWRPAVAMYAEQQRSLGRAVRTIELRLAYLRQLARVHADPWSVTYDDLTTWLASRPDWSPETRKSARLAAAGFYAEAVARGLLEVSPAARLRKGTIPRAVPRPTPTNALQIALLDADDRGRLLILLGAYAGLRAHEIAKLRPSSDVVDGVLYVTGKGGHERVVPVHPLVARAVERELQRRREGRWGSGFTRLLDRPDPDGYLFPSPGGHHLSAGHVTVLLSKALPERWTAHTLRHRFASEAYATSMDLRAVQELLGHASPTTTARYTAVPAGHLRAAVMGIQ